MTLSRTHLLYLVLICFVVLPILAAIVFSPVLWMVWCDHFEMPEYERAFGFRMESIEVPSSQGGTYVVHAIGRLQPGGLLDRAGVRTGDVPRQHHGTEFCGALAAASEGRPARIDVVNVDDLRAGQYNRREITIGGTK